MRWKSTIVLLIAAIGIGAYLSLYEIRQPSAEQRERLVNRVMDVEVDAVQRIVLKGPQAQATFSRSAHGWRLVPENVRADESRLERLLNLLSPLTASRILSGTSQKPLDLAPFGLDPAIAQLSVQTKDATLTLLLGGTTPVDRNRYVKLADRPDVFIIPATVFNELDHPLEKFRDAMLLRVNAWETNEVTVTWANAPPVSARAGFTVARHDQEWRLTKPLEEPAERSAVYKLFDQLSGITIHRFVNEAPAVEETSRGGLDHPTTEVRLLLDEAPPRTLTVGFGNPLPDDASLLYAKRSDEPSVYAVARAEVEALHQDLTTLRSKKVSDTSLP